MSKCRVFKVEDSVVLDTPKGDVQSCPVPANLKKREYVIMDLAVVKELIGKVGSSADLYFDGGVSPTSLKSRTNQVTVEEAKAKTTRKRRKATS